MNAGILGDIKVSTKREDSLYIQMYTHLDLTLTIGFPFFGG
jgi:hypothetical protein